MTMSWTWCLAFSASWKQVAEFLHILARRPQAFLLCIQLVIHVLRLSLPSPQTSTALSISHSVSPVSWRYFPKSLCLAPACISCPSTPPQLTMVEVSPISLLLWDRGCVMRSSLLWGTGWSSSKILSESFPFLASLLALGWVPGKQARRGTWACWMLVRGHSCHPRRKDGTGVAGQRCCYPGGSWVAFRVTLSWSRRVRLSCSWPVRPSLGSSCCRKRVWSCATWLPPARVASAEDGWPSQPWEDAPFRLEGGSGRCRGHL